MFSFKQEMSVGWNDLCENQTNKHQLSYEILKQMLILLLLLLLLLSSFTSLGTGGCTQEAGPVQGAYP